MGICASPLNTFSQPVCLTPLRNPTFNVQLNNGDTRRLRGLEGCILNRDALSTAVILVVLCAQKAGQVALQAREVAGKLKVQYPQIAPWTRSSGLPKPQS